MDQSQWQQYIQSGENACQQRKYAAAETAFKSAVKEAEKLGIQNHTLETGITITGFPLGSSLNDLAVVYDDQGKYGDAEPLYKRALAVDEKALGPNHPDVARDLINVAAMYDRQGKYGDAERLYKRALAIDEKAFGLNHPEIATGLRTLALLYYRQGKYGEAEPLLERALAIDEKHLDVVRILFDVARVIQNYAALFSHSGTH